MTPLKKYCLECREEIHGRRDKKFCSDYCRAQNFNLRNADVNNCIRRVNYTIRKNRAILRDLNPNGKSKAHKTKLIKAGLNFEYFTNIYRSQGKTYYFCYDQGYTRLANDYYTLVGKYWGEDS